MKESWYNPKPVNAPLRYPRRFPKRVVPSYIGEPNQVLNLLMHRGAGGIARDYSGEDNHGDINGPGWTDDHSPLWALRYDGVDDYVTLSPFPSFTAFTTMFLTRHHSVSDGDDDWDINERGNNYLRVGDDGGGNWYFGIYDGSTTVSVTVPASNDVWTLVTGRWDGSTMEIIKDDFAVTSSASVSASSGFDRNTELGGNTWDDAEYLDGEQALVMVYDTAKPDSFITNVAQKLLGVVR